MAKINSGRKLKDLLIASGTGKEKLEFLEGLPNKSPDGKPAGYVAVIDRVLFPRDKRDPKKVCGDAPADEVMEALEAAAQHFELSDGNVHEGHISQMTLEKAREIMLRGKWEPKAVEFEEYPVEFEDGEEEEVVAIAPKAKGKPGRKKLVEA